MTYMYIKCIRTGTRRNMFLLIIRDYYSNTSQLIQFLVLASVQDALPGLLHD